jgi:hypothetical protein
MMRIPPIPPSLSTAGTYNKAANIKFPLQQKIKGGESGNMSWLHNTRVEGSSSIRLQTGNSFIFFLIYIVGYIFTVVPEP